GFDEPFVEFFESVSGDDTACGVALRTKQRVIVEDITTSEIYAGRHSLDAMREADVMAVQSLPLLSSTGKVLGIVSVHFAHSHRPSEQELRLMDLLARQT